MQERRYMGMTIAQLGILAVLACAACFLMGAAGTAMLRRAAGSFSRSPTATPVVQPTQTVTRVPTNTPTSVPTAVPYTELIPDGWTQHRTALVELWLPPAFKETGTNPASAISGNSIVLELELSATASSSSLYRMLVSVAYEPLTRDSLGSFLDARLEGIPPDVNLAERRKVFINGAEAHRLVFESRANNIDVNDLMYVFQDGGTVWYVRYAAQINEFYDMLDVFEDSVKTFRVAR